MKKILSVFVFAFLASTMANAATPGGYVGLGLGTSKQHTPKINQNIVTLTTKKESIGGLGGRLFAGYNFNNYFGLEAGLAQYADSNYQETFAGTKLQDLTYQTSALDIVGKAYLPINDSGFNVYALAGAAYAQTKATYKAYAQSTEKTTTDRIRPIYGVGASFDIPQTALTTKLEVTRLQGSGDLKKDRKAIPTSDMLTLNLAYNFG